MKKALRETQTLRAGCSKADPKIFAPPQTPFPGAQDDYLDQNLICWRWSLPSPIDPVWWSSMHAISSYRGNRPTNKQTNKQTHPQANAHTETGPITIHCAAKLSAQCNYGSCCKQEWYSLCRVSCSTSLVVPICVCQISLMSFRAVNDFYGQQRT